MDSKKNEFDTIIESSIRYIESFDTITNGNSHTGLMSCITLQPQQCTRVFTTWSNPQRLQSAQPHRYAKSCHSTPAAYMASLSQQAGSGQRPKKARRVEHTL